MKGILRPILVGGAVSALTAFIFLSGALESWSNLASDQLFLAREADESIVIVAIDDASLGQIGRWPWPRRVHADIISALRQADAAAIGYDVNFPESSDTENDRALEFALRDAGNVVLPIELTLTQERDRLVFDPASVVAPIPALSASAKATGHTNTPPDSDGVVRHIPLVVAGPDGTEVDAFALKVLEQTKPSFDIRRAPVDHLFRLLVNFNGPPKKTFTTVSAVDVLRGSVDASLLRGKTVFVGSTAADLHDDQLVPTSRGAPMPGVEIHASLYDTLLNERWLRALPRGIVALGILLLGLLIGVLVLFIRARYSLPLLFAGWIVIVLTAIILFDRGVILDVVWPTITLVFAYTAVTIERRVTADRERRQLRAAFSRYVSPSVVESILNDPSNLKLGGEKRRMTVLFTDIRGFTTISETLAPEKLVEMMNKYLTRMTDIVFQNGGVLDKYIGDAVMAFWNAPLDQPDHALRAVKTALAMQKALREMNAAHEFPGKIALKIGIGINTGDMIVGNMGSETRFDYTVIGDNVNLASRMEGVTKEYGVDILITEATRREVGDAVRTKSVGEVVVKGKTEAVTMYAVLD